jgi:integrase
VSAPAVAIQTRGVYTENDTGVTRWGTTGLLDLCRRDAASCPTGRRDAVGTIDKRERRRRDGTTYHVWRARTRLRTGEQRSKTFRRKVDAEAWLTTMQAGRLDGTSADPKRGRTLYRDWLDRWMDGRRHAARASTIARDESYARNHLRPRWADWQLATIERSDVAAWVGELSDAGLAPATVRKAYQLFAASIEAAVTDRYLGVSPCRDIPLPKVETGETRFLTPGEVARLADAIDVRYRALVLVGAYGGLRIGELAGLHRDDVHGGQVQVVRTVSWVQGHLHINAPKTAAGRRRVGLPAFVADELGSHLAAYAGPQVVFPAPGGGYLQPNLFRRRQYDPAVRAAHLEGLRIHDLRHTAVSLWIASGADVKRVAARAGHASVAFTLQRYGHLYPDSEDDLMGALDAIGRGADPSGNVVSLPARRA